MDPGESNFWMMANDELIQNQASNEKIGHPLLVFAWFSGGLYFHLLSKFSK